MLVVLVGDNPQEASLNELLREGIYWPGSSMSLVLIARFQEDVSS